MPQKLRSCAEIDQSRLKTISIADIGRWEWTPGDGYRYVVYTAPLLQTADGGGPGTHQLVTIYEPFATWYGCGESYILSTGGGILTADYLTSKFRHLEQLDFRMRLETMRLVGSALDRDVYDTSDQPQEA